jgi:hypothetical protein
MVDRKRTRKRQRQRSSPARRSPRARQRRPSPPPAPRRSRPRRLLPPSPCGPPKPSRPSPHHRPLRRSPSQRLPADRCGPRSRTLLMRPRREHLRAPLPPRRSEVALGGRQSLATANARSANHTQMHVAAPAASTPRRPAKKPGAFAAEPARPGLADRAQTRRRHRRAFSGCPAQAWTRCRSVRPRRVARGSAPPPEPTRRLGRRRRAARPPLRPGRRWAAARALLRPRTPRHADARRSVPPPPPRLTRATTPLLRRSRRPASNERGRSVRQRAGERFIAVCGRW